MGDLDICGTSVGEYPSQRLGTNDDNDIGAIRDSNDNAWCHRRVPMENPGPGQE